MYLDIVQVNYVSNLIPPRKFGILLNVKKPPAIDVNRERERERENAMMAIIQCECRFVHQKLPLCSRLCLRQNGKYNTIQNLEVVGAHFAKCFLCFDYFTGVGFVWVYLLFAFDYSICL